MTPRRTIILLTALLVSSLARAEIEFPAPWFEDFKDTASDAELHRFLREMPKGGDLHHHTTGSGLAEWWLELALDAERDGVFYRTRTRIENCGYGSDEYGGAPKLLLFYTISERQWSELPECEQREFRRFSELDEVQRQAWLDGIRLNQAHEGRDEFFEAHWSRIGALSNNVEFVAEIIARNMIAFGAEGLLYLEAQVPVFGFVDRDGAPMSPDAVLQVYRDRIAQADVVASGVTLRMQISLLRFLPNAEHVLGILWRIAARHPDVVAINMVGREDNDKGYPLRFLDTARALRREYSGVRLSIHAGEVDEPNDHIRDTLLLGAERIGHGVNLITQPDVMLYMRDRHLVEINLISNLLLEYVDDYDTHPFPEYLRFGIPVALSTDDRGMWDSTMTDEFFVAVKEFDLSWQEIVSLSRNSIRHSFLEEAPRTEMLAELDRRLAAFEATFTSEGLAGVESEAPTRYRGFICRRYDLCQP